MHNLLSRPIEIVRCVAQVLSVLPNKRRERVERKVNDAG